MKTLIVLALAFVLMFPVVGAASAQSIDLQSDTIDQWLPIVIVMAETLYDNRDTVMETFMAANFAQPATAEHITIADEPTFESNLLKNLGSLMETNIGMARDLYRTVMENNAS